MPITLGNTSITGLGVGGLPSGVVNADTLASSAVTRAKMGYSGAVLQVVHTAKQNSFVGTSVQTGTGFFIDVTGLSATITPTTTTSRILIMLNMYMGMTTTSSGYQQTYRLKRTISGNSVFPVLGDGEGGRPRATGRINQYGLTTYTMFMMSGIHQDVPSTSVSTTYQVQIGGYSSGPIMYVNRSETWQTTANDYDNVPVTTLTLMEIAT